MPGTFDGYGKHSLIFKGSACKSPGSNSPMFINKLEQKLRVLIINILDVVFFKPTILLFPGSFLRSYIDENIFKILVCNCHFLIFYSFSITFGSSTTECSVLPVLLFFSLYSTAYLSSTTVR
jgi:hypothetical protein